MSLLIKTLPVDPEQLEKKVVERYYSHRDLMEALRDWILLPDANLQPKLEGLAHLVRQVQKPALPPMIYRGFDVGGMQDSMGLRTTGFFRRTLEDHRPGQIFEYSPKRPLSFSTDVGVAASCGKILVEASSKELYQHCLVMTDELMYAVWLGGELGPPRTHREVVVFPQVGSIRFRILRSNVLHLPPSSRW